MYVLVELFQKVAGSRGDAPVVPHQIKKRGQMPEI